MGHWLRLDGSAPALPGAIRSGEKHVQHVTGSLDVRMFSALVRPQQRVVQTSDCLLLDCTALFGSMTCSKDGYRTENAIRIYAVVQFEHFDAVEGSGYIHQKSGVFSTDDGDARADCVLKTCYDIFLVRVAVLR